MFNFLAPILPKWRLHAIGECFSSKVMNFVYMGSLIFLSFHRDAFPSEHIEGLRDLVVQLTAHSVTIGRSKFILRKLFVAVRFPSLPNLFQSVVTWRISYSISSFLLPFPFLHFSSPLWPSNLHRVTHPVGQIGFYHVYPLFRTKERLLNIYKIFWLLSLKKWPMRIYWGRVSTSH